MAEPTEQPGPRASTDRRPAAGPDLTPTDVLWPSLGFFGGNESDVLTVDLDGPVGRIVLRTPDDSPGPIDLKGLALLRGGRRVSVPLADRTVRQSGYVEGFDPRTDPLAVRPIRTTPGPDSWWSVRFHRPVEADQLQIYNRSDRFGYRVRRLEVRAAAPGRPDEVLAETGGPEDARRLARLVASLTGIDVGADAPADVAAAQALHDELVRALAERALAGPLSRDLDELRRLLAVVPTGHGRRPPRLGDDERLLLAHLLTAQLAFTERTPTSLASFGFALDTRAELERLRLDAGRVAPVLGVPEPTITRHGLRPAGDLRTHAEANLALVDRATADLADLGMPLMLGYGTLLGAVREGDFLAHDDDIDLLYPVQAGSREEARPLVDALCEQLRRRGWRIWRNTSSNAMNFHVIDDTSGRRLDLFPVLVSGETTTLHMERMRLRGVPTDTLLPPVPHRFRDHDVLVPHRPEAFLLDRYGPGWDVADPYDDWTWPLDRATGGAPPAATNAAGSPPPAPDGA